jgi:hypothetical protein
MHSAFKGMVERVTAPFVASEDAVRSSMRRLATIATSAGTCVADAEAWLPSADADAAANALLAAGRAIDAVGGDVSALEVAVALPKCPGELVPPFEFFETEVADVATRFVYSPKFRSYGARWRMKVYPAGNSHGTNTHISAFVELLEGIAEPVSFTYQLELGFGGSRTPPLVRVYTSVFELMDSWGWNKLLPLAEVPKFVGDDGALKMRLGIRPETYREAVKAGRSQQRLIEARISKIEAE